MTEKGKLSLLYRTYAFTKNLSFLTCQILSFKSWKISLRKKINDKNLSKITIETHEHKERKMHVAKKNREKQ